MRTPILNTEGLVLSKEQMKQVLGGAENYPAGRYQCCPGPGDGGIACSDCVYLAGGKITCPYGNVTAC